MRNVISKLFAIREGEGFKVSLMFAYGFLIVASLSILQPIQNSLFLTKFGYEKLPFVFILVAFFSAIIALIYAKYSKKVRLDYLIYWTFIISIGVLVLFWILLYFGYGGDWFLYTLYIWVAIFGVLTASQLWLLANEIYNAREAKRLFSFIGAGTISGGIFGGYLTNYLAPRLGSENLIFICIGFLIFCIFLVREIWKKRVRQSRSKRRPKQGAPLKSSDNTAKLILGSRHLLYLASIIAISIVVANLADFQFNAVASRAIPDADRLTAFFGFWFSTMSIVSLLIQLILTNRIVKHLGVTTTLFFLPMGIFFGAVALLIHPAIWSAILIKTGDEGFKHSINRAGMELLIFPVPSEIKNRAKTFIDVFVKNFAKGLGGLLLVVLTIGFGFKVPHIGIIIIALIMIWAFLILRVKDEYIDSFRHAIEKRTIDIEDQSLNLNDASVFESFLNILECQGERQILYVLNLLEGVKNRELIPHLKKLVRHPSDEIKALVLRIAPQYEELDLCAEAMDLIPNENLSLLNEAVCYLYKTSNNKTETLKKYLDHENYGVRVAAMLCAAAESRVNSEVKEAIDMRKHIEKILEELQMEVGSEYRKQAAKICIAEAIGHARSPDLHPYLHVLIEDKRPEVKRAVIACIGKIPSNEFVPILIENLNAKHIRKDVRDTLAEYGDDILATLAEHLEHKGEVRRKRLEIPKVLAQIGSQKSVNLLMKNMEQKDIGLRYEVIRALNKLRSNFPLLRFDQQMIAARIMDEIEIYKKTLRSWLRQNRTLSARFYAKSAKDGPEKRERARLLLVLALEERLDYCLERIFRLLGLKYSLKDMLNAYFGLKSLKSLLRANSIEFLDNVLEVPLKKILVPMVETYMPAMLKDDSKIMMEDLLSEDETINLILQSHDDWPKACALYLIASFKYQQFIDSIQEFLDARDSLVKETASWCLKNLKEIETRTI